MGAWGPGILSNDIAADLNAYWRENLAEDHEPEEISKAFINNAKEEGIFDDPEEEYEFWLSLALIQWKTGRLQDNVKKKALEFLTNDKIEEIEKDRWFEKSDYRKRLKNLEKLKIQLTSPQRKPQKIRKPYRQQTTLNPEDILTIKLASGNYVIFEIIDIDESHQSRTPVAILYDYLQKEKPNYGDYLKAKVIQFEAEFIFGGYTNFRLASVKKSQNEPLHRIEFIKGKSKNIIKAHMSQGIIFWDEIDEIFEEWINNPKHNKI